MPRPTTAKERPSADVDDWADRRTVAVVAACVLVAAVVVPLTIGTVALGVLVQTEPGLTVTNVTALDDGRERVAWTTSGADRTSLQQYVAVENGPWYAVERVPPAGNATGHSATTDIHSVENLTYENETISPENVRGYRVSVTAWRDGDVVSVDLLAVNRSGLVVDESGVRVPGEPTVEAPR